MKIIQILPDNRQDQKRFIQLPNRIYNQFPNYAPPLEFNPFAIFDSSKNPLFEHGEAAFFIAENESGSAVGRLAVFRNDAYNQFNSVSAALFTLFECFDDPQAANALLDTAVRWARENHLNILIGPKGFTPLDGIGLLIKGFEYPPALGLPYHPPYYQPLLENYGFTTRADILSGFLPMNITLPEKIHRAAELAKQKRGFEVVNFRNRLELLKFVPRLMDLYNQALQGAPDNAPLSLKEAKIMSDQLIWFADPRLIKVILKDGEPAGFLLAYPDVTSAARSIRGRLLPFGWLKILIAARTTSHLNINGAGILEKYRGSGGSAVLYTELEKTLRSKRYRSAEIVQIGSDNERMLLELRGLGINFCKTHRLYYLQLESEDRVM